METRMLLVFSHKLTNEQVKDAKESMGVTEFIPMPGDIQEKWSNVDPHHESVHDNVNHVIEWIEEQNMENHEYILIQGEPGCTYLLVKYVYLENMAEPVYATTKRESVEEIMPDGSIQKKSVFKHVQFRRY